MGDASLSASGAEPRLLRRLVSQADLLARGACSGVEAAIGGVVLVGLAFAVFGAHVANGGFELDDWTWASEHDRLGGFFASADSLLRTAFSYGGSRPGEAIYFAATYSLFGSNAALQLAFAIVLAGLMSAAVFAVLRTLGLERLHAGAIAFLVLL